MNTDLLTPQFVAANTPSSICEVEGETPLFDRLRPFLDSAKDWLELEYLGSEDFLNEAQNSLALKILVSKALADAIPSLDLVITPTGLGVISTESLAPASKERVERLIESLRSHIKAQLIVLVDICRQYPGWRSTRQGQYFCGIFLSDPRGLTIVPDRHFDFDFVRSCCVRIEAEMAERYLGHDLMNTLLRHYNDGLIPYTHQLLALIRSAEVSIIGSHDGTLIDQNQLWHKCRSIIQALRFHPEYHAIWQTEMADQFNDQGFVNDIKGGFYF